MPASQPFSPVETRKDSTINLIPLLWLAARVVCESLTIEDRSFPNLMTHRGLDERMTALD